MLFIQNLPIYPGVPLVSEEFSGFHTRAIPKSVIRRYPLFVKNNRRCKSVMGKYSFFLLTFTVEYKIFWLNISMEDAILMQVLQSNDNTSRKKLFLLKEIEKKI